MAPDQNARPLSVFISSTYEDLRPYVEAAEAVLHEERFEFDQFKHWEATGRPSVSECMERVVACDALVVLVGRTYGWIPPVDEGGDGRSSITRLEVRWAREKPMPVFPFFVQEPGIASGTSTPTPNDPLLAEFVAELHKFLDEFMAELRKSLGKPVLSPDMFREALRESLVLYRQYHDATHEIPAQVGEPTQGKYRQFLDRDDTRNSLLTALSSSQFRAAMIVGKGGFGKSALANHAIEQLRRRGEIDVVIYLSSARGVPIDGFRLFMSTMEASGQPKIVYEGSWSALNANPQRLFEVLLTVYRQHRILVLLDAFEHNLQDGEMRPQIVRSFVEAFLQADHASKLLITTRRPPVLSPSEAGVVQEIPLDGGLPVADSLLLLMGQIPAAVSVSPERLEAAVQAANGIPFMIERLGFLVREHRVRNVSRPAAHEDALDEFVKLAHSTLSVHARMTLQGRAVFDEPVPDEALAFVLAPEVAPVDVESAIRELGQGKFLFPVGSSGLLLGIHELDQESSYRSLAREGLIDRRLLHRRAADYYARSCGERAHWFEWTSNDELKSDIQRFRHLIRAGDTVAAANAMSISKVEFLVWSGHADTIHSMFADLDVGDGDTRAALIKHFALGDALLVSGPFEKAISELKRAIDLAQSLGEAVAEAEATIELGLAYRYVGKSELALSTVHSMIEKLRERGEKRQLAYANSSYSLACTYAGKYLEAIQAGTEQVHYGRHSGESCLSA